MDADTSQPYKPVQDASPPPHPGERSGVAPWQRAPTTPHAPSSAPWNAPLPPGVAGAPTQPRRHETPWFPWLVGGCLGVFVVLVLFCAVIAGTLGCLAFRIANRQEADEKLSQAVVVTGTPTISIESDTGAVRVVAGPDGQVHLAATKMARAGSEEDAQRQLQRATVLMRQNSGTITITSRRVGSNGFGVSLATDLTVTVPRRSLLSLRLQSGDAEVEGIDGSLTAGLENGDLRLSGVSLTGSCVLDVQRGNVSIAGSLDPAAAINLHVASGNAMVSFPPTNAVHVEAETLRGTVTVKGLSATTQRSGSGAVLVADSRTLLAVASKRGATLAIRVDSGDIVVSFA